MAVHLLALLLAAQAAPASAPTPAKPTSEKMICKRSQSTLSRVASKRVCKTAAQWRGEVQESADDMRAALSGKTR